MVCTGHNSLNSNQAATGKRRVGYHAPAAKQQHKARLMDAANPRWRLLVAFVTGLSATTPYAQQAIPEQRADLGSVRRQISEEQRHIEQAGQRRDALMAALARSEQQTNVVNSRVRQFAEALDEKRRKLDALRARRAEQAALLDGARAKLANRLRAAHRGGHGETLKLLLNLEDPGTAARALAYHTYATRTRSAEIDSTVAQIKQLAGLEQNIEKQTRTLASLHTRANAARDQLRVERARRGDLVKALDAQLVNGADRLAELRRSERGLLTLVKRISAREDTLEPTARFALQPFASERGQLLWPTRGRLAADFSSRANSDQLHWQGVFITAPPGQPVHAVAAGRVAFADWLRGFGLVVIVEHQRGFMSLYGHAQELLTEAGTWVNANETIAAVGDSGGQARTGLYFEIRKSGNPQSPRRWFKGLPRNRPATAPKQ
jgi:murein hydrolase activator